MVQGLDRCPNFNPRVRDNLVMRLCAEILQNLPAQARLLDIGCADGDLIEYLEPPHFQLYGVDIVEGFLPVCQTRGYTDVKRANVEESLPYPDSFFDAVVAIEGIEHLRDTDKFLDEICRVLKPKMLLFLTTPNLCYIGNIYFVLRGQQLSFIERPDIRWGHISYYSPDILERQLRNHGFTDITFHPEPYTIPIKTKMKRLLLKLLLSPKFIRKKWGIHLIVTAKKA